MTPEEFRISKGYGFDYFQELTGTCIMPNYINIEKFAKEYHEHVNVKLEEDICEEIKRKLLDINKNRQVPSAKHDLGYSNGFVDCYEFMSNK
ncbi:hypothetical protein Phi19:1_gp068 [Cellulophaga phage phi19:1]|uniref:Uncharacterized protein n=1 Tax=Cellulophaga phage phi19:1 TaxID=1327970 RepID=R9ZZH3_9CAUD|nr:hypothetical protein Phi19:1_gp068 [Cellulophaga phage phi19:1]AGO47358.1 hypothetical protein Phi19:1_gp068 [Cellulophaga phage phi19:1]